MQWALTMEIFHEICQQKNKLEIEMSATFQGNGDFNWDISTGEVLKVIDEGKTGKARGVEELPNEILK